MPVSSATDEYSLGAHGSRCFFIMKIDRIHEKYRWITQELIQRKILLSTMESCTSGLIASLLTDTEGSSAVFRGSLVVYSNEAKEHFGVPADIIDRFGVYSKETADAMSDVCCKHFGTDLGIGITGTFGNADPANADSIPGIVYVSVNIYGTAYSYKLELKEGKDRFGSKLEVADRLGDILRSLLENYEDQHT